MQRTGCPSISNVRTSAGRWGDFMDLEAQYALRLRAQRAASSLWCGNPFVALTLIIGNTVTKCRLRRTIGGWNVTEMCVRTALHRLASCVTKIDRLARGASAH